MNGMIFAAGLGTRLAPLTDSKPKALVEVCGKPLLCHAMDRFCEAGVTTLVVNVHHFAQQVIDYVQNNVDRWPTMKVLISDETDLLLDTGGGLVKADKLFTDNEPILVGNADVLCNVSLGDFVEQHRRSDQAASLLVRHRKSTRQLFFNRNSHRLCGWTNKTTGEIKSPLPIEGCYEAAFCGYHVVDRELVAAMPQQGAFPIIDAYLSLAAKHKIISSFLPFDNYWFDVGTPEKLATAEEYLSQNK